MSAPSRRTLVLELGVLCNNRCRFCYQQGYRRCRGIPPMMPLADVLSRIRWGRDQGYTDLSLTGGEPTIRPDFLEIVRQARLAGFGRVAITTNGRRLSSPAFLRAALDAGLDSLGVSIHGPDASVHDDLTRAPGAFEQAIQTLRNMAWARSLGYRVDLNTFTLVCRRNRDRLVETASVLRREGVDLMVFQPVLLSKSNFADARDLALGLDEAVAAVREVVAAADGFRVKPFNLPPCRFRDVLHRLELDDSPKTTYREHDDSSPGSRSRGPEAGFVRMEACSRCRLSSACPGIHVCLLSQTELVAPFEAALDRIDAPRTWPLWIPGTDLLDARSLHRVVRKAVSAGFSDVRVTTGGTSIWGVEGVRALVDADASELTLVRLPESPGSSDRLLAADGNAHALASFVRMLDPHLPIRVGVLSTGEPGAFPEELRRLDPIPRFLSEDALRLLLGSDSLGNQVFGSGTAWVSSIQRSLSEHLVLLPILAMLGLGRFRFEPATTIVRTAFLGPDLSVLNWSVPPAFRVPTGQKLPAPVPMGDWEPLAP